MSVERWFDKEIKEMMKEIVAVKDIKTLEIIFDRILTPRELNDMGRRHAIIKMLSDGKSYQEIQEKLQISSAIIAKVSNKIGYGFRRSRSFPATSQTKKSKRQAESRVIKYKGATPIHRLIAK